MRPDLQEKVHSCFNYEVEMLESLFQGGSAYCFGRLNRDCYYFYNLSPDESRMPASLVGSDQTLEIIMQELDPKVMAIFTQEGSSNGKEATIRSGIDKIFNDAVIDEFLFNPCGYSMNGLIKGVGHLSINYDFI